jgi:hypothetical protein
VVRAPSRLIGSSRSRGRTETVSSGDDHTVEAGQ